MPDFDAEETNEQPTPDPTEGDGRRFYNGDDETLPF